MNIKWNAGKYTSNFSFVHQYGESLFELIDKKEGLRCLDLGCGNGALTEKLCALGLDAYGMDMSEELLEIARKNHPNLAFFSGDATNFVLPQKTDVVFSNAVFHWIDKENHPAMLRCVYNSLSDGGQFVFEFGGSGNNALIHGALKAAFEKRGLTYRFPFYFPTIGEYAPMLENAGFCVKYAALFERPTELMGEDGLYDWIRIFIVSPFSGIENPVREEIIREAVENLKEKLFLGGKWFADYVRIRMKAVKI